MKREKVQEQTIERATYIRRLVLEEKRCPVCEKKFEGVKKRQYCSRACQSKADYKRHALQYCKARMETYRKQKEPAAK